MPLFVLSSSSEWGQQYTISTVAGGAPPPTPTAATTASIGIPSGVTTDERGNTYFISYDCVFRIDPSGVLTRVAGTARPGFSGDGGPATSAQISTGHSGALLNGVAVDAIGNLYFADSGNNRIRRVTPSGIISTYAGDGTQGYSGDGDVATRAQLNNPQGVAVDSAGNLYIADSFNYRVRRMTPNGIISTFAGTGAQGYSGDGGLATEALLVQPTDVAVDTVGNLYIADVGAQRIERVTPGGIISTVAGNGTRGFSGDGGPATSAQLAYPSAIALDATGNLYIVDSANQRVRQVMKNGTIRTYAGDGTQGYSGDGGPATSAQLSPRGVATDGTGGLLIGTFLNRIRRVSPGGMISTAAGNGTSFFSSDGGPATLAQIDPDGVAVDAAGDLYICDLSNNRIRRVTPSGIISTVAGSGSQGYSGDGGPATSAQLARPNDVAVDSMGNLYIADTLNHRLRRVTPNGTISTLAGDGTPGYSGDGGSATSAQLSSPKGVAVDVQGNVYVADTGNVRIRRITSGGVITTIAGSGASGYSGDNGPATSAQFSSPSGVAVDAAGNIYVADTTNLRVRRVTPGGIVSTVAGTGLTSHYSGDGGPATSAGLWPQRLAVDATGNLYIAAEDRILRVTSDGIIYAIAGTGTTGYSGDGGPAASANLYYASGISLDTAGRVFFSQLRSGVRVLTPTANTCSFSATPTTLSAPAVGGAMPVSVQGPSGCTWSIAQLPDWITASALSGSGPATVTISAGANGGSARSATILVAGTPVTVNQASGATVCSYVVSPGGQVFGSIGGDAAITVTTMSGCVWTATSSVSWVNISSTGSGTGSGTLTYKVGANSVGPARSGTITVAGRPFIIEQLGSVPAGLGTVGTLSHIASGGGWKTILTLVNNGAAVASVRLNFVADTGTELTLPLTFPQAGTGPIMASVIERTLNPGATLVVECDGPVNQDTQQGWALVQANGGIAGFGVFRQTSGDNYQEAVVPLETRSTSGYVLAFDNTQGVQTGVALANVSASPAAVTVIVNDDAGSQMLTVNLNLVAHGHTAFVLSSLYPVTSQRRGTIEFRPSGGGQISLLGLRFAPKGAFTTIPVMTR
jgi:sugar lactone lactonase YvrE